MLYYRDQGKRLTNLSKMNKKQQIQVVAKREIPLNDLKRFYNLVIDNKKTCIHMMRVINLLNYERNGINCT